MWEVLFNFALKSCLYLLIFTIIYNAFIIVTKFKYVKFAWNYNMFFLPQLPLVGTAYLAIFGKARASLVEVFLQADKYFGGLPCNFWFGSAYAYCTDLADEAKVVLNHPKCLNKAKIYDNIQVVFRNSILTVPAEKWKPRRLYLRPAFKRTMIKSSYAIFYEQSCLLLEDIKKLTPQDDLFKFFNQYAFLNFFLSSFGLTDESKTNANIAKMGKRLDVAQDELVKIFTNPALPAEIWKKSPLGAKLRRHEAFLKDILNDFFGRYAQEHKQGSHYFEPGETPLVGLLLDDAYIKDSEDDLFEEFCFICAAATDTTGHTLAFVFVLLGMYPEIQAKAFEEIQTAVGDRNVEFSDLPKLKYVEAIISETLRILPTVPVIGRNCDEDINLGNKILPKGSDVFISIYHLHRNPKYWEKPLKFDPTRFLPENASKIVQGSYAAFSLGPRNCIGQAWATALSTMTIANVIRSFELKSAHKSIDEFELESCISMKTINLLDCQFMPRK